MQTQSVYSPIQAKSCYVKNEDLLSFRLHFGSNNMHRAEVWADILQQALCSFRLLFYLIRFVKNVTFLYMLQLKRS